MTMGIIKDLFRAKKAKECKEKLRLATLDLKCPLCTGKLIGTGLIGRELVCICLHCEESFILTERN